MFSGSRLDDIKSQVEGSAGYWALALVVVLLAGLVISHLEPNQAIALLIGLPLVALLFAGPSWVPVVSLIGWFAVIGTSASFGPGRGVPLGYLLLAYALAAALLRRALGGGAEPVIHRIKPGPLFLLGLALAWPMVVGLLRGNDLGLIRSELFVVLVAPAAILLVLVSCRLSDGRAILVGLYVTACLAACKTLWLVRTSGEVLQAGRSTNGATVTLYDQEFGAVRLILIGGDTILAIGIPIGVLLLADRNRRLRLFVLATLPLCILALVLTYTRTLLMAAAIGAILMSRVRGRSTRGGGGWGSSLKILSLGVITVVLLSVPYGNSQYSALDAVSRRFLGGEDVGSGSYGQRLAEAGSAIGTPAVLNASVGRGFGSTYLSPLEPMAGQTGFTEIGFAWIIMKGGVIAAFFLSMCVALLLARTWRHRSEVGHGTYVRAFVVLLLVLILINTIANRFVTLEGMALFGLIVGFLLLATQPGLAVQDSVSTLDSSSTTSGS